MKPLENAATALLLVDIQNDYFDGGRMPLHESAQAAVQARALLERFRALGLPVVHVQHISTHPGATFFLPKTPGAHIHESVTPLADEAVVVKHFPNSFRETTLLEVLSEHAVRTLVIAGMMTHMCVDAAVRAAADHGFSCTVAQDACATRDLDFDGRTIAAEEVHAAFLAALSTAYAQVLPTKKILETYPLA
jgi:nicotinamidase-related amidase